MENQKITIRQIIKIYRYAKKVETKARFNHSKRVAEVSVMLSKKFHLDKNTALYAALAHDICKHYDRDLMIKTASRSGNEIYDYQKNDFHSLHGVAASVILKEEFFIQNKELLEAVECHVGAKIGMNDYSKILYIADKSEPKRKHATKEYRKKLFSYNLTQMVAMVLDNALEYIINKGYTPYPGSKEIVDYYKKEAGF